MPDLLHRLFTSRCKRLSILAIERRNSIPLSTKRPFQCISTYFRHNPVQNGCNSAQFDRHDQHTLTTRCKEVVYYPYYKKYHIHEQERVQVDNERLSQVYGTLS